ncbi:hypothetical protein ACFFRL_06785 [Agromyces hippuratus]|uniref:hypothetical protein n=1 Tax=Agromyces hippuratus TaxID=286438 RepID=UPI0035EEAD48
MGRPGLVVFPGSGCRGIRRPESYRRRRRAVMAGSRRGTADGAPIDARPRA